MFKKNVTGTKVLIGIGIAKAFLTAGQLRTRGDLPLDQLLDENAKKGGDLNELLVSIFKTASNTGSCGLDFDLDANDIKDIFDEDDFPPITELPAGAIELILNYKILPKKTSGELSLTFNVKLTDETDEPSIALSFVFSTVHFKKIIPVLKNQFLVQNRIGYLVSELATKALLKAEPMLNLAPKTAERVVEAETKEVQWLYAEQILSEIFGITTTTKKIPNFSVIIGINISEKLTLSMDFTSKPKKK
ncbi:MAG: hypothetical protein WCP92_02225 [bacterium]